MRTNNLRIINEKLIETKLSSNRNEAIKDVLEFTLKNTKVQFHDELKKLENSVQRLNKTEAKNELTVPPINMRRRRGILRSNIVSSEKLVF